MKKLTKQQFLDMKIGEVFEVSKEGFVTSRIDDDYHFYIKNCFGIELIPEKPPITVKNLGRFMARFGEYPEVSYDNERDFIPHIEITDPRWTAENLEGGE